jgi:phage terminase large subunit
VATLRKGSESDIDVIHSTWEDNNFLPSDYVETLKNLIREDQNYYNVYTLGLWGRLEGRIFSNFEVIPCLPTMVDAKWCYGLDFGLINPTALVKVFLFQDKTYLQERIYKPGLTVKDIVERLTHEERGDLYFDPTAKQMGEEISRAGFSAWEGHRGVKETIDLMQRQKIYIPQESVNLIKELQNYSWKKDPNNPGFIPEPIKYNDHAVDAARYGIWGITERYGFSTQRPHPTKPISTLTFNDNAPTNKWGLRS